MTDLSLAADTNTGVSLSLPLVDLTGYALEMIVSARGVTYTATLDDGLDLVVSGSGDTLESLVTWNYTQEQSNALPLGAVTVFDLYGTFDGARSKLAAGKISVDGAGELTLSSASEVVPGIQGARGWAPIFSAVLVGSSIAMRVEDWTGGGGDKPATGQYLGPDGLVDDAADATLFASLASAQEAIVSAAASAGVASVYADAASAAADAALASRDEAREAVANPIVTYETLAGLNADLSPKDRTLGQVIADGDNTGLYIKNGGVGAGSWVKTPGYTIPLLSTIVAALQSPISRLEERPETDIIPIFWDLANQIIMSADAAGLVDFVASLAVCRQVIEDCPADAVLTLEKIIVSALSADDEHPLKVIVDDEDGNSLIAATAEGLINLILDQESIENISVTLAPLALDPGRADARIPDRNDDASRGYAVGNIWPHKGFIWQCQDASNGVARWSQKARPALAGDVVTSGRVCWYSARRALAGYDGVGLRLTRESDWAEIDIKFLASGLLDMELAEWFTDGWSEEALIIEAHDNTGNHGPATFQASYGGQTWQPPRLTPLPYFGADPGIHFPTTFTGHGSEGLYTALVLPDTITGGTRSFSAVCMAQFIHISANAPLFQLTANTVANSPQLLFSENTSRLGLTIFSANYARGFPDTHKPPSNRPGVWAMTSGSTSKIYAEEDYSMSFSALGNDTFAGGLLGSTSYPLDTAGKPGASGAITIGAFGLYDRQLLDTEVRAIQEALYADWRIGRQTRGGVIMVVGDSIARASIENFQGWFQQIYAMLDHNHTLYNGALGGSTFGGSIANISLWEHCYDENAMFNIAILAWGTNDIAQDISFAQLLSDCLAMIAAVRAMGNWTIVIQTVIPRQGFVVGTRQAVCDEWNAYLRSNWRDMGIDLLVDMAADPVMGDPGWYNVPGLALDSTHPATAGHKIMAEVYAREINAWVQRTFGFY